jgi:hypothetical protein
MTALQVVLLVVGILVLVGSIQVVVWTVVLRKVREGIARVTHELETRVSASGEKVTRGPMRVRYTGATGGSYGRVKGVAVAALTDKHLFLQTMRGAPIEFTRDVVTSVRQETWFRTQASAGWTHVVLTMMEGYDVGFAVRDDPEGWVRDIQAMLVA